jgi:hypothetical protein
MTPEQLLTALRQNLSLSPEPPKKKRKRGGLAGIWDRNKGVIKPLVSGIAGAVGGPIGGALAGGLMGGLDRPGKSGVGFDLGRGVRGAASGALAGAAGAGLRGYFTGSGGLAGARQALGNYGTQMGLGQGGALRNAASGVRRFAEANPVTSGAALTTAGNMMAANQQARVAREQEQFERDLFNRQEDERRALADALLPLFISIQNRASGVR